MNRRRFLMSSGAISAGALGSVQISSKPTIAANTNLTKPANKTVSNDIEFTFSSFDVTVNNLSGQRDIITEYSLVHNQVELRTATQTLGTTSGSGSFTSNRQKLKLRDFDLSKGNKQYKIRVKILVKNGSTVEASAVTESDVFDISCSRGGIARYTLDSDDTFTDSNGNQKIRDAWGDNDSTNNGSTVDADGILGTSAYEFNGSGDYVEVGSPSSLSFSSDDDFTISCWIRSDEWTSDRHHIVSARDGNTNWISLFAVGNDDFRWQAKDDNNSNYISTTPPQTGVWTHMVGTHISSSNEVELYLNSQSKGVDSSSSLTGSLTTNWAIGRRSNNSFPRWYDGKITDVRIYDRALSESEVTDLHNRYN